MVDNLPEAVDGDGGTPQADASDMASSPQQQAGEAGSSGDEGLSDDEAATGAATTDTGDSVSDSSLGDDQPQQGPEQSTDAAVPEEASGGDGKAAGTAIEPPETPVKSKRPVRANHQTEIERSIVNRKAGFDPFSGHWENLF